MTALERHEEMTGPGGRATGRHRRNSAYADAAAGPIRARLRGDPRPLSLAVTSRSLIAGINAWNRLNVITQQPAGDYQPGQWG